MHIFILLRNRNGKISSRDKLTNSYLFWMDVKEKSEVENEQIIYPWFGLSS